jgi:hypothetical protein
MYQDQKHYHTVVESQTPRSRSWLYVMLPLLVEVVSGLRGLTEPHTHAKLNSMSASVIIFRYPRFDLQAAAKESTK